VFPEFTIQGVMRDKNSAYYQKYGQATVTATGCKFTGTINLFNSSSEDGFITDTNTFNAKKVIFS
jgi:hypothetical protein